MKNKNLIRNIKTISTIILISAIISTLINLILALTSSQYCEFGQFCPITLQHLLIGGFSLISGLFIYYISHILCEIYNKINK